MITKDRENERMWVYVILAKKWHQYEEGLEGGMGEGGGGEKDFLLKGGQMPWQASDSRVITKWGQ